MEGRREEMVEGVLAVGEYIYGCDVCSLHDLYVYNMSAWV